VLDIGLLVLVSVLLILGADKLTRWAKKQAVLQRRRERRESKVR
jgi:hypothetical protein